MSISDEERLRRMGAMYEGDHLGALERLEAICTKGTPGQAAGISKMLAHSATHAGTAMAGLVRSLDGNGSPRPSSGNKGPLPSTP